MIGNIQRKIVVVMLFVSMMSFDMQGMIITENQAKIVSGVVGTVASVYVMSQSSRAAAPLGNMLVAGTSGASVGGIFYLGLREYTPEQIIKRAEETDNEICLSRIGQLVRLKGKVTNGDINKISSTGWPCIDALQDTAKYELCLNKHIQWLRKAQKSRTPRYDDSQASVYKEMNATSENDVITPILERFEAYKENIGNIRSAIYASDNLCYKQQMKLFEKATNTKIEKEKLENEKQKTKISGSKANTKRYAVLLKYWKWILGVTVTAPILLCIFMWGSEIPHPTSY